MKNTSEEVTIGIDNTGNVWVLVKEIRGFIFRDPRNLDLGYGGHFKTEKMAIDNFMNEDDGNKKITITA